MKKLAKLPGPQITLVNEVDDDPSPPVDFEFLDKLKLGDGLTAYDPSSQVWGCNCPTSGCVDPTSCTDFDDFEPDSPHRMFAYGKHGRLLSARGNEVAIYECNLNCPCDMGCVNRLVQRGRKIPLEIFKTANKGWGLRCPQKLQRGVLVEVYLGEVITSEEADKRYGFGEGVSYLFQLDKFSTILEKHHQDELSAGMAGAEEEDSGEDSPYCIDGKQCGSVARFINHSCQPNLDVYCVVSDRRDGRVYDIALFTNRIIEAGEELTFSYTERHPKMMDSKKAGTDYAKCLCGAKKCAGYLWTAQNVD
ncbi:hypothetical protein FN846DRAFT_980878 [Sphaerosporella brunnea]|uniref:SET domain-containing protein n=1 Tax=Sphaerosporella brunnea TaxID=1250544 RepID=A0A5J5EE28_9PEZI|nr:hypothetical protein FN846DRAFT_980878 [Sphaerosporella brunnea]